MMLTLHDFIMLADFIRQREEPGGSVKILEATEYEPDRVLIDWPITEALLDEFNRIRGHSFTTQKPTKTGWYWYRNAHGKVRAIEVVPDLDGLACYHGQGGALYNSIDKLGGEWAGPLEPPR